MRTQKYVLMAILMSMSLSFSMAHVARGDEVVQARPEIGYSEKNDLSLPLYLLIPQSTSGESLPQTVREIPIFPVIKEFPRAPFQRELAVDFALQDIAGPPMMPSPLRNFQGINNVNAVLPPDTNGAAGPNHFVQMVNLSFAVWDKTGKRLYGPVQTNTLWAGFGGACQNQNDGDGLAIYDRLADRWVMSQFALPNYPNGPFYQCIAVSQTGNPTGAWYRYAFLVSQTKLNDYPKIGVWPDAYYMTANQYAAGSLTWAGAGAYAFNRNKMLLGQPANFIYFDLNKIDPNLGGMLPSTVDGPAPPAGSPNFYVQFDDNGLGYPRDQLEIWKFHVDWTAPLANSTFTGPALLPTAPFDSNMCNFSQSFCIPQPGTSKGLDAIADRMMYRLQYRNFGGYQTLVTNHTVNVNSSGRAGVRWYELRKSGGAWSIYQQGTFAPADGNNRWMGSIAMDGRGNIALGYSISSSTVYPSIRYTGRLATDPLGKMTRGESTLIAGAGSQTYAKGGRWGDYSSMAIDPSDNRTFWYTQEYYPTTSLTGWHTRIGSFKFGNVLPTVGTLTPSLLTSAAGVPQTFTAVYSNSAGYTNLKTVDFLVSTSGGASKAIWVRYSVGSNTLHLFNDAATAMLSTSCTPGTAVKLQNSQGILSCAKTTVSGSGNNLTVKWNVTPKTAFASAAAKKISAAANTSEATSGWVVKGSWTINP